MRPPVRRVLSVLEFISSSAVLMRGGAEERLACKGSRRDVPASGIKDHASALSNDPRRLLYGRLSEKASTRTAERSARSGPITPRWRTHPRRFAELAGFDYAARGYHPQGYSGRRRRGDDAQVTSTSASRTRAALTWRPPCAPTA